MRTIPILRIFDYDKAIEFYVDWLGFTINWKHQFEPNTPYYMEVQRGHIVLHLSEHYGDATPGSGVYIEFENIREYCQQLSEPVYKYYRPSVVETPWQTLCMGLQDPFGNKLSFNEQLE
jgi:catechol 2,3-dioxygenase-like lactoylglutathione lyase family enzyme